MWSLSLEMVFAYLGPLPQRPGISQGPVCGAKFPRAKPPGKDFTELSIRKQSH